MKRITYITLLSLCIFFTGCAKNSTNSMRISSDGSEKRISVYKGNAYTRYSDLISAEKEISSFSAAVNSTYTMSYSDDSQQFFVFDGVFEKEGNEDPKVHLTQNIESNGDEFNSEGYYYNGRLYNSYNGIQYYEDMSIDDLQKTMLVPMQAYGFKQDQLKDISAEQDENENIIFKIHLNDTDVSDFFSSRYDSYGLDKYDDYKVESNEILDTFDSEGSLIKETSTFQISVSVNGQKVKITYQSTLNLLKLNSTEVNISKALKKQLKQYVYYEDIDTSNISDNQYDDSVEKTAVETFKKRLVNRLGYTIDEDGLYQQKYNDNEAYTIDFKNDTFTYTNYSIHYTYNWKGNIGTMGSCTVNFGKNKKASSCEDSTADMIKTVEQYFEMELYYCGLSLSDLQNELEN